MEERSRRKVLLGVFIGALLAAICLVSVEAEAELFEEVGTSHTVLGAVGMDARAAALGWSVTSLDMGAAGMEFNPAGLAASRRSELCFGHSRWVQDVPLDQVLYARPLGGAGTLAFGLLYMDMGSVSQTLEDGSFTGESFAARDLQFSVNFAMPVHRMLSVGVRGSFLYKNLADESAGTFTGSLGLLSREISGIRLGAALLDVGPPLAFAGESLPSPWRARFGASHRLELAEGHRLLNALDLVVPRDNHPSVGVGSEWTWNDLVFLRLGYRRSVEDDGTPEGDHFHYGGGLAVGQIRIDYAYGARADFQPVHRLALSFELGAPEAAAGPRPVRYLRSSRGSEIPDPLPEGVRVIEEEEPPSPADPVTLFADLAFSADRSKLLSGHFPLVDDYVARLERTPGLSGIELQGYEADTGNPAWDRKRALQKLHAFKDALVVRGVPADRIGLMAYGSDRPSDELPATRIEAHVIK